MQSLSDFWPSLFTRTGSRVMDHTGVPGTEGVLEVYWLPQLEGTVKIIQPNMPIIQMGRLRPAGVKLLDLVNQLQRKMWVPSPDSHPRALPTAYAHSFNYFLDPTGHCSQPADNGPGWSHRAEPKSTPGSQVPHQEVVPAGACRWLPAAKDQSWGRAAG